MIVISHATFNGTLPQPSGPSIKQEGSSSIIPLSTTDEAEVDSGLALKAGKVTRVMGRSTSMFQQPRQNASSSRSSTPSNSIKSSRDSCNLLSTPASTVRSDVSRGDNNTKMNIRKMDPVVEIDVVDRTFNPNASDATLVEDPAAILYDVPTDISLPPFARKSTNASRDLARVWEAVAGARRITVICGAGISVSSPANIPDFRSTAGLFRKLKEKHPNAGLTSGKDLFDASLFNSASTSSIFYSMIAELKAMADAAAPTTFHHLLKRLDMEGRLQRVYTQNIDGLEERAGLSFGLGQTGDSRAALRALGKRKRGLQKDSKGFARSKSDSAVLFTQKQEAQHRLEQEHQENTPMFPRAIPLHGSLSTLTCGVCNHKIYLSLASSGPQEQACQREYSPEAPNQALAAMDLLSQGESVSCVKCQDYERVRSVAGLRSRGVGIMKVDVVLYNGQNDGAEQVGDCVQRDILGLRDPNETSVPESAAEKMARERKEKKEKEVAEKHSQAISVVPITLDPISEASNADDAFASAFGEEQGETMQWAPPTPRKKQPRAPRLKPLPPDLLIVAGTSLKVPGTKRIVREFAKACHARDRRVYPSSDESDEEDEGKRSRGSSRGKRGDKGASVEEADESEEEDINAPIRTVLLNYDFPVPPSQWEDVFDVWVQGDVQQSALGLWEASKYSLEDCVNGFSMREDEHHQLPHPQLSWSGLQSVLEESKASKKAASKKSLSQQQKVAVGQQDAAKTPPSSLQSKASTPSKAAKSTSSVKAKSTKTADASKKDDETKSNAATSTKPKAAPNKTSEAAKVKTKAATASKKPKEAGLETFMHPTKPTAKPSNGKKSIK